MSCEPTEHFLPDYDDWGDVSTRLENLVTVPISRVPKVLQFQPDDPPFHVFACSWFHLDQQGPLTKEKFEKDLDGALRDFAEAINKEGEFRAYPITHTPPTSYAVAYHDWRGGSYPFDLRAVISFNTDINIGEDELGEPVLASGLKFHLVTLVERRHHDEVGE